MKAYHFREVVTALCHSVVSQLLCAR